MKIDFWEECRSFTPILFWAQAAGFAFNLPKGASRLLPGEPVVWTLEMRCWAIRSLPVTCRICAKNRLQNNMCHKRDRGLLCANTHPFPAMSRNQEAPVLPMDSHVIPGRSWWAVCLQGSTPAVSGYGGMDGWKGMQVVSSTTTPELRKEQKCQPRSSVNYKGSTDAHVSPIS